MSGVLADADRRVLAELSALAAAAAHRHVIADRLATAVAAALDADGASVVRFRTGTACEILGRHPDPQPVDAPREVLPARGTWLAGLGADERLLPPDDPLASHPPFAAGGWRLAVPIELAGAVWGAVAVARGGERPWREAELGWLRGFVALARTSVVAADAQAALGRRSARNAAAVEIGRLALADAPPAELTASTARIVRAALDVPLVDVALPTLHAHGSDGDPTARTTPPRVLAAAVEPPPHGSVAVAVGTGPSVGRIVAWCEPENWLSPDQVRFLLAVAALLGGYERHQRALDRLLREARFDRLTGLPNRLHLCELIDTALAVATGPVAVLCCDLDRFKLVNDHAGYDTGDHVLRETARLLADALGTEHALARIGGDHFAVLASLADDPAGPVDAALAVAARLRAALGPLRRAWPSLDLTIGIAVATDLHDEADVLLRDADTALARAKAVGPGSTERYAPEMRTHVRRRVEAEQELRRALEHDELRVVYQPIIRLDDAVATCVEALVRWRHPTRGAVSPGEFIPLAEQTGQIHAIGSRVLDRALDQLARWRADLVRADLRATVNLSARQLDDPGLAAQIEDGLARHGLPPSALGVEITETALLEEGPAAQATLARLHALGVAILLDDFGVGFSSLSHLKTVPLGTIKLDRSFVAGLGSDRRDTSIVGAVCGLARALDLDVIAEGIEHPEQVASLLAVGCPYAQGYHFSRPLEPADATAFLARRDARPGARR